MYVVVNFRKSAPQKLYDTIKEKKTANLWNFFPKTVALELSIVLPDFIVTFVEANALYMGKVGIYST